MSACAHSRTSRPCALSKLGTSFCTAGDTHHSRRRYAPSGCWGRYCLWHSSRPLATPATPPWERLRWSPWCRSRLGLYCMTCRVAAKPRSRPRKPALKIVRHARVARSRYLAELLWGCSDLHEANDGVGEAAPLGGSPAPHGTGGPRDLVPIATLLNHHVTATLFSTHTNFAPIQDLL